jgi:aminoglycoside phosphotransferase (APT) family kinase protein
MKPARELEDFVLAQGLAASRQDMRWTPLAGGVSSDIWRVDLPERSICIKRALPKLKVAADWYAPTERNAFEWKWLQFAAQHVPQAVPKPVAHDAQAGLFAMEFLDPEQHPVWKTQLLAGHVDATVAAAVARIIVAVHQASAGNAAVAREFATRDNFHALRLEPYLVATGRAHPDLAPQLNALAERTGAAQIALVHGDVSPKNILIGAASPILLDAECAWYGDPAFDIAFCLNHLLLKCLVHRELSEQYMAAFDAFVTTYMAAVRWEPAEAIEARAAALLPALLLARVDGKSPVEYLRDGADKDLLRRVACPLVAAPVHKLADVAQAWRVAMT